VYKFAKGGSSKMLEEGKVADLSEGGEKKVVLGIVES
jgi:hypothetical protein